MPDLSEVKRKLAAGELGAALQDVEQQLQSDPEDIDALYLQAVLLRYLRQYPQSLSVLQRLKQLAPAHSRAHQEEGHVHRDRGATEDALRCYGRALALNPALESSLREMIQLLRAAHRERAAIQAQAQLDALLNLPRQLRSVMELVDQNKLLKAEQLCRAFLQQHPKDIEGMRLLADIGIRLGVLDDAEFLLESAAAFAPDNLRVRMEYVQVLRKRQKFEAALAEARSLVQAFPGHPQVESLCAIELMQTGEYDQAMGMLDGVLAAAPGDARTLVTYGHALKTCGRSPEAVDYYRRAIESEPLHGESYYSLANLKTYRFNAQEREAMQALLTQSDAGFMDRVYLHFALGKAWEDEGDYESAFAQYARGNALKKAQSRYDAQQMHDDMRAIAGVCDEAFFAARSGFGASAPDPIFIVGLPRAGSTLLEQILSSHSQVDGTLELPNILALSQRLRRRSSDAGYPGVLAELTADECLQFGRDYIQDTQIHRAGAPFFIDKMPNNFRYIGLIRLILPHAKIIDARREPMACCFSGFKQLFAEGQEFSYDLADIGRYYHDYVDLMHHWDSVLPGHVLRVQHEDVVEDLEGQVRRILAFCDLPFEDQCLRYYETDRNVRTPSSEQVRQPIFRDGLEQWRQFEPWLSPLREVLQGIEHD